MASIKERLIQVVLRGKDLLSPEADKSKKALEALRDEGEKLRTELDKAKADTGIVRTLDGLNKAAERTEKELERAKVRVSDLQDALNESPESAGLVDSLGAARREARAAERALDKLKQQSADMAEKAKAAGIDTGKLAEEEKRLAGQLDKTQSAIRDNSTETSKLRKEQAAAARSTAEQESRTKSLRSALAGTEKRVLAFAAAYISLNSALGLVRKGLELLAGGVKSVASLGDSAAKTSQQLAGLMGGGEAGAQAGKWIEEFADKTGRRINDVTQAFVGLKAYGLDPMDGSLEALINKTTQLGGDASTLQGISLALGQMWAKEKIVQEEVNQLRERGVNAFDLLAKAMGKTSVQIQEMAVKGQLGRKEIKLLIDEIGKSADGAAAGALDTLSGKWSVLQNQFQKFGERIASSGVMELLNEKLQGVLDTVGELTEDGTLDNLAVAFADAFGQGAERVEEFVKSLAGVDFKNLIDQSAAWLSDFGSKIDAAVEAGQTASRVLTGVWHGFRSLVTAAATVVATVINQTLGNLMRVQAAVLDAIGLDGLAENWRFATGLMEEMQNSFADATVDSLGKVQDAIAGVTDENDKATQKQKESFDERQIAINNELKLSQAWADQWIKSQKEVEDAHRLAAVEGKRAFTDMADALDVIDSTDSVAELEKLRQTFLQAGKDGTLSQQEMEAAVSKTSTKITQLGKDGATSAKDLKSLEGVMQAIKTAANDIDVRQAKSALDKLYREGAIDAKELKEAQDALNAKVAELKPAAEKASQGMKSLKVAADEAGESALKTNADFRMVTSSTKDAGDAADSAGASFDFFGSVLSQAREPLAGMSAAALDAFDKLQGLNSAASAPMDTSSLQGVQQAAERVRRELGELRHEQDRIFNSRTSVANWALDHIGASKEIQLQYLGQKQALMQLIETANKGNASLDWMASLAGKAASQFNLLSQSDLSPLIAMANQAKESMKQFAASTETTVDSLRMELLQLQGTEEEIARARSANRRKELLDQMAIAQANKDNDSVARLQEALGLLAKIEGEQISRIRQAEYDKAEAAKKQEAEAKKREQEAAAREAESQRKATESERKSRDAARTGTTSSAGGSGLQVGQKLPDGYSGPTKVIRLESAKGRSVDLGIRSASDEVRLLDILSDAGMRTL